MQEGNTYEFLSPRERVLKTINFQEPDRVPLYITITPQVAEVLSRHLGFDSYTHADSPLSANRISFTEPLLKLGNDIVGIGACSPIDNPIREVESGILTDEWQVKYRSICYYSEIIEYPLAKAATIADIEKFNFPDPSAKGRFDLARQMVEKHGDRYAICGDLECTIFEGAWHLVGMDKLLIDLCLKKDYTSTLLDRIMEYSIGVGRELTKLGADIIWLGDDMGTQRGMMISPNMWRQVFKDRLRTVIQKLKEVNPSVKIAYHSCGSYAPIIPELIEVGVDILNALQPNARDMDLKALKDSFGSKVAFLGGLDIQKILPFGSLEDIENEVKRVISSAGKGGGLILAGAHNIQPDTSVEKIEKVFQYAKKYGTYPLNV